MVFNVLETEAYGRRHGGTLALVSPPLPPESENSNSVPLTEKDLHIALDSTAGIPYRDPDLISERKIIQEERVKEVLEKRKAGMPKWYREKECL